MAQQVTKLDAARRQLVTAIRLHLDDRDPVSVYTLATNAQEVLSTLCEKRGVRSMRAEAAKTHGLSEKEIQRRLINEARNFFKHADKDPNAVWPDLKEENVDAVLFIPCFDLVELERKSPIEVQVFITWYGAVYPHKVISGSELQKAADDKFPGLASLPRSEQKRHAREMIETALQDATLVAHPETDQREIGRWS